MTGFSELEDQLLDAIERKGSRRGPRASTVMVVASSAMVVVLVAVAILALGHRKPPPSPSRPPAGSPPPPTLTHTDTVGGDGQVMFGLPKPTDQREVRYVMPALYGVSNKHPACSLVPPPNPAGAALSQGAPDASMLSVLGVLRRPAAPADRLPAPVYHAGRPMGIGGLTKIYVRYIRRARVVDGVAYYVIPGVIGSTPPSAQVLNRCYAEEMQALRGRLTHVTKSFRAQTLKYGAQVYAQTRAYISHQRPQEGVTELNWQLDGRGGGGGGGATPATIRQQGMLGASETAVYAVVPSGVARITLQWPGAKRPSLTAKVIGNVFVVKAPGAAAAVPQPTMIWRSASGRVIKVVRSP